MLFRSPLSDGQKKEMYRDVLFFHGAIQLSSVAALFRDGGSRLEINRAITVTSISNQPRHRREL